MHTYKSRCCMQIVAGKYKSRKIIAPKGDQTRPTSSQMREALFNICNQFVEDSFFLDLFAGSGAMGLEALSRGAKKVTFVEIDKECVKCIKKNIELLEIPPEAVRIIQGDVFLWLPKLFVEKQLFNIVFADPPYEMKGGKENIETMPKSNKVVAMVDQMNILSNEGSLFVEESKIADPIVEGLESLKLKSFRHMGKSMLLQYKHKE